MVNSGSCNILFPDGTRLLPEQMLPYYKLNPQWETSTVIKIPWFSLKTMHMKMSYAIWPLFCSYWLVSFPPGFYTTHWQGMTPLLCWHSRTSDETCFIRALGRHFLLRVLGPHHLSFQGPQAKFEGSLHWNTLPILQFWRVHWAPRQNFTRASLDLQGPGALTSGPLRALFINVWENPGLNLMEIIYIWWTRTSCMISQSSYIYIYMCVYAILQLS